MKQRTSRASARPRQKARLLLAGVLLSAVPVLGSAAPAKDGPSDPFERLNRATYAFNDALDRMLARPAARAYSAVVPAFARKGISNFLDNLQYPVVIVNDALQGKLKDAGSDTVRFVLNTIAGVGGFGDPATRWGFQSHDEDFGQTLGYWGLPPGPFIVIPVLGPSDFRDGPGKFVDTYISPSHYVQSKQLKYGLYGLTLLNRRAELLSTDTALRNAYDPYVFVRNAYLARRNYLVHDGNIPDDPFDEEPADVVPPTTTSDTVTDATPGQASRAETPQTAATGDTGETAETAVNGDTGDAAAVAVEPTAPAAPVTSGP